MKQAWHADNFKIVLRKVVCRHLGFSNGNFVSSTDEALNMKIRHIKTMFRLKQLDAPSTKVSSNHLHVLYMKVKIQPIAHVKFGMTQARTLRYLVMTWTVASWRTTVADAACRCRSTRRWRTTSGGRSDTARWSARRYSTQWRARRGYCPSGSLQAHS